MKKKLLNIAIRVDANDQIGGGHFRRCLSLAEELKLRGHKILIISASLPIKFCQTLKDLSIPYKLLDQFEQSKKQRKLQAKSEYGKWLSMPMSLDAKKTNILLKNFMKCRQAHRKTQRPLNQCGVIHYPTLAKKIPEEYVSELQKCQLAIF